mmetsp:Transcript_53229/g.151823  ORF Transcript_53229/g.151823 Transcript_53229/m.151823 type:complete len:142 (-) Transcript_53229:140-565(-)
MPPRGAWPASRALALLEPGAATTTSSASGAKTECLDGVVRGLQEQEGDSVVQEVSRVGDRGMDGCPRWVTAPGGDPGRRFCEISSVRADGAGPRTCTEGGEGDCRRRGVSGRAGRTRTGDGAFTDGGTGDSECGVSGVPQT